MARGAVVARVQALKHFGPSSQNYGYEAGKFFPLLSGKAGAGPSRIVPGVVLRGGMQSQFAALELNLELQIGDVIVTGPSTLAAIEFLIGGRVGINRGSSVEIVNERSVADGKMSIARIGMKNLSLWTKGDHHKPLEIQTNGGVMGIKG